MAAQTSFSTPLDPPSHAFSPLRSVSVSFSLAFSPHPVLSLHLPYCLGASDARAVSLHGKCVRTLSATLKPKHTYSVTRAKSPHFRAESMTKEVALSTGSRAAFWRARPSFPLSVPRLRIAVLTFFSPALPPTLFLHPASTSMMLFLELFRLRFLTRSWDGVTSSAALFWDSGIGQGCQNVLS